MTIPPQVLQGLLPQSTIVPKNDDLFIPYFTRVYEDIAQAVNAKDGSFFTAPITDTATNIPNIANFGAFILCVSAQQQASDQSFPPTITASLCKSSTGVAGSIATLGSQAGQGGGGSTWVGATLTISSTATNFQINHSVSGVVANFNFRIIGTQ